MTTLREAYEELVEKSKEIKLLSSIGSVINWDQEAYMP
ncbi:MAG: carboxypeptidase M32 [Chloroflexi bacterium]|nr:carboxypeptidase M32 [Chloroflexota bacterium]